MIWTFLCNLLLPVVPAKPCLLLKLNYGIVFQPESHLYLVSYIGLHSNRLLVSVKITSKFYTRYHLAVGVRIIISNSTLKSGWCQRFYRGSYMSAHVLLN